MSDLENKNKDQKDQGEKNGKEVKEKKETPKKIYCPMCGRHIMETFNYHMLYRCIDHENEANRDCARTVRRAGLVGLSGNEVRRLQEEAKRRRQGQSHN